MHELDLIPEDYRRVQLFRQILIKFAIAFVLTISMIVVGKLYINNQLATVKNNLQQLQQAQQQAVKQQQTIAVLEHKKAALHKQLSFIELLKGGENTIKLFLVFDRVMDGSVWLTQWNYQAGNLFTTAQNSEEDELRKMEISGQANDHQALAKLVDALLKEEEIQDVKIRNTTMMSSESKVVNFTLELK